MGMTKGRFLLEESVVESYSGERELENCSGGRIVVKQGMQNGPLRTLERVQ